MSSTRNFCTHIAHASGLCNALDLCTSLSKVQSDTTNFVGALNVFGATPFADKAAQNVQTEWNKLMKVEAKLMKVEADTIQKELPCAVLHFLRLSQTQTYKCKDG